MTAFHRKQPAKHLARRHSNRPGYQELAADILAQGGAYAYGVWTRLGRKYGCSAASARRWAEEANLIPNKKPLFG